MQANILLLGNGCLSNYIQSLSLLYDVNFHVVSARSFPFLDISSLENFDYVIDLLDPATSDLPGYSSICDYNTQLRIKLLRSISFIRYFYISTTNIYQPLTTMVDELSPILPFEDLSSNSYLLNKYSSEQLILSSSFPCTILRSVSLFQLNTDFFTSTHTSFFHDLRLSRHNNTELPTRKGDEQPFSFLHFYDAACLVLFVVLNSCYHVPYVNITNGFWSDRFSLKKSLKWQENNILGRRIVSNILPLASFHLKPACMP